MTEAEAALEELIAACLGAVFLCNHMRRFPEDRDPAWGEGESCGCAAKARRGQAALDRARRALAAARERELPDSETRRRTDA